MVKAQLGIPREYWRHHHRLLLRIKRGGRGAGVRDDERRKRYVQPGGNLPQRRYRRTRFIPLYLPEHGFRHPGLFRQTRQAPAALLTQMFEGGRQMLRNIHPTS